MRLIQGDCLEEMKGFGDQSIELILTDLPYGSTACEWDVIIPFELLWNQYERIIKDNGAILLFAQTPFDKILGCSNLKLLRYEWIWEKTEPTGFFNAKKAPLKAHENILCFYKKPPVYNPQKISGHKGHSALKRSYVQNKTDVYGKTKENIYYKGDSDLYPRDVLIFSTDKQANRLNRTVFPTQKPVALLEYLIKTYTNKGDLVLDSCMGSGSTGCAAVNTQREFIGIEKDENTYKLACKRIQKSIRNIEETLLIA